jgi:outer membrane protein assembly factor BamB
VANGIVYLSGYGFGVHGDAYGQLAAFDAHGRTGCSGTPKRCTALWSSQIGASFSSPAVARGVVYVGSDLHTLYAFDAASGAPLWTSPTGTERFNAPAVANGVVYASPNNGNLYAFDAAGITGCSGAPKTCTPLWTAPRSVGVNLGGSPAVAYGMIYIGANDQQLHAFALP